MVAQNLGSDRLCNRLLGRALPGLLLARSQPGKRFGDVHHLIILLGSPVATRANATCLPNGGCSTRLAVRILCTVFSFPTRLDE